MRFGTPFSAGFGSPQNALRWDHIDASVYGEPHRVAIEAAPGFADAVFGIYVNGVRVGVLEPGEGEIDGPGFFASATGTQSLQILREGHSSETNLARAARAEQAATAPRAALSWTWPFTFLGATTTPVELSGWSLTGVLPSLLTVGAIRGRFEATATLTVAAGIASVEVRSAFGILCYGSGAVGTTITLVTSSASGVAGTVDVVAGAVGETLTLQWRCLAAMLVLRGGVQVARVPAPAEISTIRWSEPADLAGGTYSYTLKTVSDTGVVSAASSPVVVNLANPPAAPTALRYVSGGSAAIALAWTASTTVGVTYNMYIQSPDEPYLNLNDAVVLPAGTTTYTLPAQMGYPGFVRVLLRAEKSGVEERVGAILDIELDGSGVYVSPRPNTPQFATLAIAGATFTVSAVYDPRREEGVATQVQLFARAPGGAYNFASPVATGTLVAGATFKTASLSWTGADGTYLCVLKARTASGVQSESASPEATVELLSTTATPPTFTVEAARS